MRKLDFTRKAYARIAGLFYLFIIGFGLIAQIFVRESMVDFDNATVTAKNIAGSEFFYRFGFVSQLLMLVSDIIVTTILYILLKSTSRNAALVSTFFRVVSISVLSVVALSHYAAVVILGDSSLSAFSPGQQDAMMLLSLKLHGPGYNISLFFFGFHLLFLGYLVYHSRLFPRLLGYALLIAGICYIANSLVWFLFPSIVSAIYPAILIPCFLAELFLCLFLLIKGLRENPSAGTLQRAAIEG